MPATGSPSRIRGRKAVALRLARLAAEPWCRDCKAKGIESLSRVPDHIVPLKHGGIEDGKVVSPNVRCLCHECHAKRTAEQFGHRAPRKRIGADGWPVE